jgi:hypothetical protein
MGQTVNTNAFRFGSVRSWPLNSSKLFNHNVTHSYNQYDNNFQSYYFFIISKRVVESIFSDSNFFRFSINFADCKIEDYSKITFLNIYLFSPSFRRFYKIFSKIFSLSKRDFRLETIDVSSPSGKSEDYSNKPRAGKYTHSRTRHRDARSSSEKQITTTGLQQKKIFFYRFVAHILLNSLFKSKSNRRSLKVRKFFLSFFINFFKCKNLGVLNPLVFASFFKIFFFFFF